ncbi:MAG: Mov34/MPN/PAD-1 family protein [bacterium]|nr:Mov34/MPN/PAD-1 family protein [bacterium]
MTPPPTLVVPCAVRARIERAAVAAWPTEMVGLLVGSADEITDFAELQNEAGAGAQFTVEPADFAATLARTEVRVGGTANREFVGFVHSHPDGRAAPSPTDLRELWRDCVHLIVGVRRAAGERSPRVTGFWGGRVRASGSEPCEVVSS